MKILYGVAGEGMGHATRSRVVLDELVKEHEVRIVTSGRACEHLLVYQTAAGNETLPDALTRAGVPCRIYGLRPRSSIGAHTIPTSSGAATRTSGSPAAS